MAYMQWLLAVIFIVLGLIGGYWQIQMMSNLKAHGQVGVWFGRWVFHPEYFNPVGQSYRRKIIGAWIVALLMCVGILFFSGQF